MWWLLSICSTAPTIHLSLFKSMAYRKLLLSCHSPESPWVAAPSSASGSNLTSILFLLSSQHKDEAFGNTGSALENTAFAGLWGTGTQLQLEIHLQGLPTPSVLLSNSGVHPFPSNPHLSAHFPPAPRQRAALFGAKKAQLRNTDQTQRVATTKRTVYYL